MGSHVVLLVFVLCYNILYLNEAQFTRNFSQEEELDIEIQLKMSNKPSIKAIQEKHGDIDCVDIYQQLAFEHPLLKNHTIDFQIMSTPLYYESSKENGSITSASYEAHFKVETCPTGTIPIRRIAKTDIVREIQVLESNQTIVTNLPNTFLAVARTKVGASRYTAARGDIRIDNPKAVGQQFSTARIRIQAGHNSIEAGWKVDPDLYGDSATRFFIRTDAGQTHCFNTFCPGFIHINRKFPLDSPTDRISKPGGPVYTMAINILRKGDHPDLIGYWPSEIFPGLADRVEWGGATYSPQGTPLPPMGSGNHLKGDPKFDGFISNIRIVDDGGQLIDLQLDTYTDNPNLYSVRDGGHDDREGHYIMYGGPGHL